MKWRSQNRTAQKNGLFFSYFNSPATMAPSELHLSPLLLLNPPMSSQFPYATKSISAPPGVSRDTEMAVFGVFAVTKSTKSLSH